MDALLEQGDLYVWGFNFALKTKPRTDLIPFPMKFLVPPFLKTVLLKKQPSSVSDARNTLVSMLRNEAYVLVPFDDTMKEDKRFDTCLCVFGRRFRLAPRIAKFMLDTPAKDLIVSKRICLPVGNRDKAPDLLHIMLTSWENGAIPVLLGHLPYSKEVTAVCDSVTNVPKSTKSANSEGSTTVSARAAWAKLLSTCSQGPKHSMAEFSNEMAELVSTAPETARMPVRVYVLRFRAGAQEVVHPVAVVTSR